MNEGEKARQQVRHPCPCCHYPTLSERGGYDICQLCNWEDDGQDDEHADEVWGGPNGAYSLAHARRNFERYGTMYDPSGPDARMGPPDSPLEADAKRGIIAAFDALPSEPDEAAREALWDTVRRAEDTLESELGRKVDDSQSRNGDTDSE